MKAFAMAALAAAALATGPATYTDPAGDAVGGGPDVTALTIDAGADGRLQLTFTVQGMGVDTGLWTYLDTDRNPATGDNGSESLIEAWVGPDGALGYDVDAWNGSRYVMLAGTTAMRVSVTGDTWTIRVGRADIGNARAFTLVTFAASFDADGALTGGDRLPDAGEVAYAMPAETVVPWIGRPALTPSVPRAGARLTVSFPVTRRDTGAPLTTGTMTCDPRVDGKVLRHSESFAGGNAVLRFTIPRSAKGKTLKVNLTIRVGAQSAHTVATFRVR